MNCPSKSTLQKALFKVPLPLLSEHFLHEMKIERMYRVLLPNWLQWLIFTISSGRRGYEKLLLPWVYPWSFPHEERSHLQDCNQTMCEKSDSGLFCRKEQGLTRHEWLWSWKISWWVLEWVLWKKWWGLWQSFLNWLQLMIFTIFLGRRICCTQAMKKFCSLEFIHTVFLTREKPFTRFQSNHVWEIWSSAVL